MLRQAAAVKDWGTPVVPEAHAAQINAQLEKLRTFDERFKDEWKLVGESGGFKYYAPSSSQNVKVLSCFAEGTLDCSASVAFEVLNDANLVKKLDDNVNSINVLSRDEHNRYTHVAMKGMYWTAPREVVTLDHWFVDDKGVIHKVGFSVDRPEVPEHPDPSVKVRALSNGWTELRPDPEDDRKCHLRMQVDIDVRLEHVPQTVQRLLAGSAQRVNAQNFGNNLKQVNKMVKKLQRSKPASHLVVNKGGALSELHESSATQAAAALQAAPELDFSDIKAADVVLTLLVLMTSSAAILSAQLGVAAAA